jgi:hypothetical protein
MEAFADDRSPGHLCGGRAGGGSRLTVISSSFWAAGLPEPVHQEGYKQQH